MVNVWRGAGAAALTSALVAGQCVAAAGADEQPGSMAGSSIGSSTVTSPVVQQGDRDPFYDVEGLAVGEPGTVLKTKEAAYSNIFGPHHYNLPRAVKKIMYSTLNSNGQPTPVTGYVVEPVAAWEGPGARPTLVIGRGTVGQGDQCAPSRNWPLDGQPDPVAAGRLVNLEGLYDWIFASNGVRVVVTDYVGMGTPGMHTYMNRDDQGHAMLDAARAARELVQEEGKEFGQVGFYGHSQGGGASAAALEVAQSYAPDLNVAGGYASAPPADLDAVQRNIDGSDLVGAIGFTINGLLERYPHLRPLLEEHLSADGQRALDDLANMCTGEITEKYGYQTTDQWTNTGQRLDELLAELPEAKQAMDAQFIGHGKPVAPVMIVSGQHDLNVEYLQGKKLAKNWCANGGEVVYRDDFMPEIGEYNHFAQAVTGGVFGMQFMLDRFRNIPVAGTCSVPDAPAGSVEGSVSGSADMSATGSQLLSS